VMARAVRGSPRGALGCAASVARSPSPVALLVSVELRHGARARRALQPIPQCIIAEVDAPDAGDRFARARESSENVLYFSPKHGLIGASARARVFEIASEKAKAVTARVKRPEETRQSSVQMWRSVGAAFLHAGIRRGDRLRARDAFAVQPAGEGREGSPRSGMDPVARVKLPWNRCW
jgi:hypothetical protein